ncbi:ABC transporter substrate-binding protein [Arthrobacter sp. efr-133-TYG-104]|uniref:ABC transporter substrate-binding protein n=1 Tax=Arthrobacter sp. efr-133-TYG-104 TaxID=3040324 RepID=UPI00254CDAB6|nr:ABC transporter substrate-binding protein [Arthrobacter sp. efr-133-TYG-104]
MSHPIDVGSVLGGRYKVTANVLTSHDQDQVLDGVDQVLNRPVSILVAGPGNAEQVAQSAREVATGERPGHVQILDLGISENTTYLITNHSSAPDLLDLVVATNPPYIEPFFTETLGSEIFGEPRTYEPETYDGLYEDDEHEAEYIQYDENGYPIQSQLDRQPTSEGASSGPSGNVPPMPAANPAPKGGFAGKLAAAAAGAGAAGAAAAAVLKNAGSKNHDAGTAAETTAAASSANDISPVAAAPSATAEPQVQNPAPPAPVQPPTEAAPIQAPAQAAPTQAVAPVAPPTEAAPPVRPQPVAKPATQPKVSLWSEEDYGFAGEDSAAAPAGGASAAGVVGAAGASAALGTAPGNGPAHSGYDRKASNFPASAAVQTDYQEDETYEYDRPQKEPRSMRWLVGGLLAAVLIVGLILAVTNLGSLMPHAAAPAPTQTAAPQPTGAGTASQPPSAAPTAPPAPPAIDGITRLGDFPFAATFDKDLVKAFDGNAASYWSDMEFATADWGGLSGDVPLVIKLKEPTSVSSVVLDQLGGSGGSISVFTNDRPAMDGAKLVGTNSFTSPELTMPLSAPTQTQYVIVDIKTLPKLAVPKTRYGYGLRLAEVQVH